MHDGYRGSGLMPKIELGGVNIKIDGDEELMRKFKQLGRGLRPSLIEGCLFSGANIIRDEARSRAPRRTGALQQAIISKRMPMKFGIPEVAVSWRKGTASRSTAFYGIMVEKGTKERVRKDGGRTGKAPDQAFLIPAYDAKKEQAYRAIKQKLSDAIVTKVRRLG